MAAIATKKKGADKAVLLTYPAVFQDVYADSGEGSGYMATERGGQIDPMIGEDYLAHVHYQRKQDADRMAMAAVESKHNSTVRALTGPHGYHLPPAVLGQRKFANPSNGSYFSTSARRDDHGAPFSVVETGAGSGAGLHGGAQTDRTALGQGYARRKLLERVGQLNAIAAAKVAFQMPGSTGLATIPGAMAPTTSGATTTLLPPSVPSSGAPPGAPFTGELGDITKLELSTGLQSISDSLAGDAVATAKGAGDLLAKSVRIIQLLARQATYGSAADIESMITTVDSIVERLGALQDDDYNLQETNAAAFSAVSAAEAYWDEVRQYLVGMMGVADRQPRDRVAASKVFLAPLTKGIVKLTEIARIQTAVGRRRDDEGSVIDLVSGDTEGDDDDSSRPPGSELSSLATVMPRGGPRPGPSLAGLYGRTWRGAQSGISSLESAVPGGSPNLPRFSRPGARREDSEQGTRGPTASFDPRPRETFGYASGQYFPTGGRATGYFGEAAAAYGAPAPAEDIVPSEAAAAPQLGAPTGSGHETTLSLRSLKNPDTGEYDVATDKKGGAACGGSNGVMTRAQLPTTLDGFKQLSAKLAASGGAKIRVNANSRYGNVRRNFIRKLGL